MAYRNILKKDTYSYIDNVYINKNLKIYSFIFYIYEDKNKEKLLLEKNYNFSCKYNLCKFVDKIYTSEDELKDSLKEIYYNNPNDQENKPGFYDIKLHQYIQINEKKEEIKIEKKIFIKKEIPYVFYKDEYFISENQVKTDGLTTNYYFDNVIFPSINNNIIEVLYNTLEIIESSYKEYPKI